MKKIVSKKETISELTKFSNENNYFKKNKKNEILKLSEIIKLIKHQKKSKNTISPNCRDMRENIFDWLLIANTKLKFSEKNFLLTIDIIDEIIEEFDYTYEELYLISVTAIFTGSKFEEVLPILLHSHLKSVCHNKFTKKQVIDTEMLILKKLNFKMPKSHFLDFSFIMMNNLCKKKVKNFEKVFCSPLPQLRINNFVNQNQGKSLSTKIDSTTIINDELSEFSSCTQKRIVSNCKSSKKEFNDETDLYLFKNLVFLYSITIHKLLKFEYSIMKKYKNLELYFGILYASFKKLNLLFESKFEILEKAIFKISEKYGVPCRDVLVICEEIFKLIKENCICSKRFQYLFIWELSKFQV